MPIPTVKRDEVLTRSPPCDELEAALAACSRRQRAVSPDPPSVGAVPLFPTARLMLLACLPCYPSVSARNGFGGEIFSLSGQFTHMGRGEPHCPGAACDRQWDRIAHPPRETEDGLCSKMSRQRKRASVAA
jgi:hypothetical protein